MLRILIVEDESLLAATLKHLIELNPRYEVTDIADDFESALAAVEHRRPHLALVDLQLARGSTGFSVAVKLNELGVACLLTTGKAPPFPMPDLALGCLTKPYTEEDVVRALKTAEDKLRGRERLRPSLPTNLQIYSSDGSAAAEPQTESFLEIAPTLKSSIRTRLSRWLQARTVLTP